MILYMRFFGVQGLKYVKGAIGKLRSTENRTITDNTTQIHTGRSDANAASPRTSQIAATGGSTTITSGFRRNAAASSPCNKLCTARKDPQPGHASPVTE